MIEVLKKMYQLLLTEPHAPAVCDQLEPMLREAIAELESQEPDYWLGYGLQAHTEKPFDNATALYTHPPQRTEQEPVAFLANGTRFKLSMDDEGKVNCFWNQKELDGRWVALVAAEDDCHLNLTHPPQRTEERNFCPRCGKRTADLTTIHTCTPPQELI